MSIVGVYKEIQDQHMNIVSIMKKNQAMASCLHPYSLVIFPVESFLRWFVGAVGNEFGARYEGRTGKIPAYSLLSHPDKQITSN